MFKINLCSIIYIMKVITFLSVHCYKYVPGCLPILYLNKSKKNKIKIIQGTKSSAITLVIINHQEFIPYSEVQKL